MPNEGEYSTGFNNASDRQHKCRHSLFQRWRYTFWYYLGGTAGSLSKLQTRFEQYRFNVNVVKCNSFHTEFRLLRLVQNSCKPSSTSQRDRTAIISRVHNYFGKLVCNICELRQLLNQLLSSSWARLWSIGKGSIWVLFMRWRSSTNPPKDASSHCRWIGHTPLLAIIGYTSSTMDANYFSTTF